MNSRKPKVTIASTNTTRNMLRVGGGIIVYQLYRALAAYCDVELVYLGPANHKAGQYEVAPGLTEIVVPRTQEHLRSEQQLFTLVNGAAYDLSLMTLADLTPDFQEQLERSAAQSDVIIVDRFYYYDRVKKICSGQPILHRSQNVEYFYEKSLYPNSEAVKRFLEQVFQLEAACCEGCDHTFPCTNDDKEHYHTLYGTSYEKMSVLLNGVNCEENRFVSIQKRQELKSRLGLSKEKVGIFIGAAHQPNVVACETILEIAPNCPDTKFFIIGPVCQHFSGKKLPKNLGLLGAVTEETRKYIFSVSDFALNPMQTGSGSNVKMVDYMAAGIPVLSSAFGARGIQDEETYMHGESVEEYADLINHLDQSYCDQMTKRARRMVEKTFDWNVLVKVLLKHII